LLILISSCKKEKIPYHPFEINRNISCDDLYDNGFKRLFGIDVLMIGKKMNDTIIHYQVTEHFDNFDNEIIENQEIDISEQILKKDVYHKYIELDALELNDSIYELVWENIEEQSEYACDKGEIYWRNFIVKIDKSEIKNYRKTIDTSKYKIIEIDIPDTYLIDSFEVLNLKKKDTFYCSIYERDKKHFFSSTISIINYE
jgi:hypothetical protein